jgi:hypothetical protein
VPLYGSPTVTGDSMSFTPSGFGSFAQNGGLDITDGQLVFKVLAKPGQAINNITFSEAGAVSLLGLGGAGTSASDSLAVHITILEVNGGGISAIHLGPADFAPQPTFNPKGSFNLATDGQLNLAPWTGNLSVTFLPFLLSNGFKNTDKVTKISVDLDNQLMTISQANPNTIALIDKKTFFTVTTNTPEPASCVLALIGFVGAAFFARRRSV